MKYLNYLIAFIVVFIISTLIASNMYSYSAYRIERRTFQGNEYVIVITQSGVGICKR